MTVPAEGVYYNYKLVTDQNLVAHEGVIEDDSVLAEYNVDMNVNSSNVAFTAKNVPVSDWVATSAYGGITGVGDEPEDIHYYYDLVNYVSNTLDDNYVRPIAGKRYVYTHDIIPCVFEEVSVTLSKPNSSSYDIKNVDGHIIKWQGTDPVTISVPKNSYIIIPSGLSTETTYNYLLGPITANTSYNLVLSSTLLPSGLEESKVRTMTCSISYFHVISTMNRSFCLTDSSSASLINTIRMVGESGCLLSNGDHISGETCKRYSVQNDAVVQTSLNMYTISENSNLAVFSDNDTLVGYTSSKLQLYKCSTDQKRTIQLPQDLGSGFALTWIVAVSGTFDTTIKVLLKVRDCRDLWLYDESSNQLISLSTTINAYLGKTSLNGTIYYLYTDGTNIYLLDLSNNTFQLVGPLIKTVYTDYSHFTSMVAPEYDGTITVCKDGYIIKVPAEISSTAEIEQIDSSRSIPFYSRWTAYNTLGLYIDDCYYFRTDNLSNVTINVSNPLIYTFDFNDWYYLNVGSSGVSISYLNNYIIFNNMLFTRNQFITYRNAYGRHL